MALLLDDLFIDETAFADYRDISEHSDIQRLNESIREAQISDLAPFLGEPLYLELLNDFTPPETFATPKFDTLFNGEDYDYRGDTIRYHGLQPMLTMFAYARYLNNLQLYVSRGGPVTYMEADVSEPAVQAQIKTKVIDSRAMAVRYQQEAIQYLDERRIPDYPTWGRSNIEQNKTFKFIKLGGNSTVLRKSNDIHYK